MEYLFEQQAECDNSHVLRTLLTEPQRDKAWQVFPYPCVGEFGFLDLNLCQRAAYQRILCKLKAHPGARHLDVGCCVGQDIRRLVYDGVPSSQIVGLELERGFVELGYDLFLDNPETLHTQFVIGNMLDDGNAELNALEGTFDTFHVGLVLHLFNLQEQVKFLKRIMKLSKRDTTVLVVGHCIGHVDGVEVTSTRGELTMRHNLETWEKLWHQVSEETGTKWKLRTDMDDLVGFGPRHTKWRDPERRRILFEAERE